ncbi:MAG: adenosylcobinamide-phosphate synthase CbiB [Prolixibacteraceae bacterium]|nr:adenosylcobinamide-phosphate synthase CbiB [Prolixibacteraceae bacterium]
MTTEQLVYPLLIGFVLDLVLGDPNWLPHPIRWFGWAIAKTEQKFNNGDQSKRKGALIAITLLFFTWLLFFLIQQAILLNQLAFYAISSIIIFYGLANRSLISEGLKVENQLSKNGLEAGRKQLCFIVGRDTSNLNENQIRIATLETLAENLSDGVIAPLFYYAIGGFPLMMSYKMANTLDSMIGYKSERYKDFGCFAARFDDVVNFIPARITALLMVLLTFSFRGFKFIFKFGHQHASPNAGYPEAALAGILNCQFGGPNIYHGKIVEKQFIGENKKEISACDLYKTALLNAAVTLVMIGIIFWAIGFLG